MFARSHVLPLPEARKIWKAIANPGSKCAFEEKGCKGGAVVESERKGITKNDLLELNVPENAFDLRLRTGQHELVVNTNELSKLNHLDRCILADAGYPLPDYGWNSNIFVVMVPKGLNTPLRFEYHVNNALKAFGRKYDLCHIGAILYLPYTVEMFRRHVAEHGIILDGSEPSEDKVEEVIVTLFERFGFPTSADKGFLELAAYPTERSSHFDPSACHWGWEQFESMIRKIAAESPCPIATISSHVNPGYLISGRNIGNDVKKLAKHIADTSLYEKFDVTISALMSMSWNDREKLRKKWKQPILQEVGTLKFNGGGEAEVKIIIEKEGYVFHIEFESPDDIMAFEKTPIWKKAEWMPDK